MPPFLPLQGVFAARAHVTEKPAAATAKTNRFPTALSYSAPIDRKKQFQGHKQSG